MLKGKVKMIYQTYCYRKYLWLHETGLEESEISEMLLVGIIREHGIKDKPDNTSIGYKMIFQL